MNVSKFIAGIKSSVTSRRAYWRGWWEAWTINHCSLTRFTQVDFQCECVLKIACCVTEVVKVSENTFIMYFKAPSEPDATEKNPRGFGD